MVRIINIDTKARTIRVSNGKDDLEWFTTDTGSHVPLKKGQSKAEAIKKHFGDKKAKQQPAGQKPEKKMSRKDLDKAEFDQWFGGLTKEKQDAFREYVEDMKKSASGTWVDPNKKYAFSKQSEQPAKKVKETYADTSEIDGAEVFKDGDDYVVLYANGTKTREFSSKTEADKFAKSLSKQPAKPDTSNADYFKSTMQETMKKFPRLYEHEQKHLEEYAVSAFNALRNNPGKEKAIVDEILDSYNQHVKRLGMWVDTPTLAKKAFVEKLAEAYK